MTFIDSMKAKYQAIKTREAALEKQARARIPVEYQDFLLLLDQNQKISDKKVEKPEDIGPSVWSSERGTYVPTRLPYMAVDGRVRWALDEHKAADKKLSVEFKTAWTLEVEALLAVAGEASNADLLANLVAGVPQQLREILVCIVDSEIYGRFEGSAKIGWGGREVDATNPYENSQTSAVGRALGFMGYGLIGTGIASYEEVKQAIKEREEIESPPTMPTPRPAQTGRPKSPTGDPGIVPPRPTVPIPPEGDTISVPQPSGTTTSNGSTPAAQPERDLDDEGREVPAGPPEPQQDSGPCVDCGKTTWMDKFGPVIKKRREKYPTIKWAHGSVPNWDCAKVEKAATKGK